MTEHKISPDDRVAVWCRVWTLPSGGVIHCRAPDGTQFFADPSDILSVEPAPLPPLKVGDRVRDKQGTVLNVLSIVDELCVVSWQDAQGLHSDVLRVEAVSQWERLP